MTILCSIYRVKMNLNIYITVFQKKSWRCHVLQALEWTIIIFLNFQLIKSWSHVICCHYIVGGRGISGRGCIIIWLCGNIPVKISTYIFLFPKGNLLFHFFFIHVVELMAPITEKTSPLPSKLKWLSSLKGNGTHNALWVTCDPFCLFWSDTTCHGKLDWPAHLKMCTFIFNFTGLLVAKYWLFLGEVSPQNFLWNWPIFLRICPKNPSKFDFFLLKSREIGRFFCEFWLFSCENPTKSADFWANFDFFPAKLADFSANLPRKSREILLFSAKYQKPWL